MMLRKIIHFFYCPRKSEAFQSMEGKDFLGILLFTFVLISPYTALMYTFGLDDLDNEVKNLLEKQPIVIFLIGIFIAPILEEPIYRLHLDLKKKSIFWGLGLSVLLIDEFWYPLVAFWIYLIWLLIRVSKNNPPPLKFVMYSSAIFFGLVHLGNYTSLDYHTQFYLIPILVGAQIFVGLIISYIRLTYGMKWAMIFHGVYNAVLIGSYLLIFDIS